jgi:hypothetical protein
MCCSLQLAVSSQTEYTEHHGCLQCHAAAWRLSSSTVPKASMQPSWHHCLCTQPSATAVAINSSNRQGANKDTPLYKGGMHMPLPPNPRRHRHTHHVQHLALCHRQREQPRANPLTHAACTRPPPLLTCRLPGKPPVLPQGGAPGRAPPLAHCWLPPPGHPAAPRAPSPSYGCS